MLERGRHMLGKKNIMTTSFLNYFSFQDILAGDLDQSMSNKWKKELITIIPMSFLSSRPPQCVHDQIYELIKSFPLQELGVSNSMSAPSSVLSTTKFMNWSNPFHYKSWVYQTVCQLLVQYHHCRASWVVRQSSWMPRPPQDNSGHRRGQIHGKYQCDFPLLRQFP
jgi:hypothetical protein